jgi:hypothetical protein
MAQDFLKRKRLGADQYGFVLGTRTIVQFVAHTTRLLMPV